MITPEIIEAVEVGILNDDQLKIAITHYKNLEKNLGCHGEIYALVWRDVYKKLRELEGYKKSRQDNNKLVMNKIEQMHLDSIQNDKHIRKQLCVNDFGTSDLEKTVAAKSAEITEQIAIEFAEWIWKNCEEKYMSLHPWESMFEEFLNTKQ